MPPVTDLDTAHALAATLGGFVCAEGTFVRSFVDGGQNGPRPSFTFAVSLGATDAGMCHLLRELLRVGSVRTYPRRSPTYDDETTFAVRSIRDLVDVIVPLMDEHLPPSHKRGQYESWRAELLDYDRSRASRAGWSRRRPAR